MDDENYAVYVDYGEGAEKVKTEKNGSYLCFEMSKSGSVIIQKEMQFWHFGWTIIIAAVAAAGIFLGVKVRKRKK